MSIIGAAANGVVGLAMMGSNLGGAGNILRHAGRGIQRMGGAGVGQGATMTGRFGRGMERMGVNLKQTGKRYDQNYRRMLETGPDLAGGKMKMPSWNKETGKIDFKPYKLTPGRVVNHGANAATTYGLYKTIKGMGAPQPVQAQQQLGGYGDMPQEMKMAAQRDIRLLLALAEEGYHAE